MALRMSPVSRNLHAKVTMLGLELEDMLFLAMTGAGAMLVGQFLLLMVLVVGVPALMLFKYGKPRGYLLDLAVYYATPRSYCALAHDQKLKSGFIYEAPEKESE